MKQINKLKIIMFSLIIIGTILSIIGIISTGKQQKIKKQITTENMLFTYETIKNNNYNKSLTEKEGLTSNYQEIKITSSSSSPSQMNYLIYIKPKTQTIKDDEINVYITDEKNIPVSDEYKDLQNGKGKYCYDYINKIKYNIEKNNNRTSKLILTILEKNFLLYIFSAFTFIVASFMNHLLINLISITFIFYYCNSNTLRKFNSTVIIRHFIMLKINIINNIL